MSEKLEQYRRDLHEVAMQAMRARSPMALLGREAAQYRRSVSELIEVLRAEAER